MSSLKSEHHGRIFKGTNWRKVPERKIVQRGRMCDDASWREMPEADQCGQTFKDANWRQMSLEADKFGRTLKDVHCDGMDRDVQSPCS
jgi:hypothetical protein